MIQHFSYRWEEFAHQQDEGPAFRGNPTDEVAVHLGLELIAGLVRRPFLGLVADAHPYVGWATHQELSAAVGKLPATVTAQRDAHGGELRSVLTCLEAAAAKGYCLVTIYHSAELVA